LAAEIKKLFQIESELIQGSGGVYKVWADSRLLWNKHETGRFPEEQEILHLLGKLRSPA
jgi:selenoprotein W-related protein